MSHYFFSRIIFSSLLLVALFTNTTFAQDDSLDPISKQNLSIVDKHIIPAYQALVSANSQLKRSTTQFCQKVSPANMDTLKADFKQSMQAWQAIQHIRFGPIENSLRNHRIQMWPDKRGKIAKHLRKLLKQNDSSQLASDSFQHGSVAVQGYSAMEQLLFNSKVTLANFAKTEQANYRCQLIQAIANNLQHMSQGIVYDWQDAQEPFRVFVKTAANRNAYYESEKEIGSKLLNSLVTQITFLIDYKIDRPLGKPNGRCFPKRAESWRSGQSISNIKTNLIALNSLYNIGYAPLLSNDKQQLKQQIFAQFEQSQEILNQLADTMLKNLENDSHKAKLQEFRASLVELKRLCSSQLPEAIDIPLGFNSLDGD